MIDVKKEDKLYKAGLKCTLFGTPVTEMSKEELIIFIGFLDEALTKYQKTAAGLQVKLDKIANILED